MSKEKGEGMMEDKSTDPQPLEFNAILSPNGEWQIKCRLMHAVDPMILKCFMTDLTVAAIRGYELLHTPKIHKPSFLGGIRKMGY